MVSLAQLFAFALAPSVAGHAFLAEPPSRNMVANQEQKEYCPHCLQAGGPGKVESRGGGVWPSRGAPESHGLCGDPVQGAEEPANWRDETYLKPTPVQRTYRPGEIVEFHVGVSTHHRGHYEFRICDQALDGKTLTSRGDGQNCLDRWTLHRAPPRASCKANDEDPDCQPIDENHPERWYLPPQDKGWDSSGGALPGNAKVHKMRYMIPANLTCTSCTLQWYYSTGNTCLYDGDYFTFFTRMQALGWPATEWCNFCTPGASCTHTCCGEQSGKFGEEFWNCADIAVLPDGHSGQPGRQQPEGEPEPEGEPGTDGQQLDSDRQQLGQPDADGQQPGYPITDGQKPAPTKGNCSAQFGQCGGKHWTGATCCQQGSWCHRQNEWYSQCLDQQPGTDGQQSGGQQQPGADGQPSALTKGDCSAQWGQCGGKHWTGARCCQQGSQCHRQSEWYSQCLPGGSLAQHKALRGIRTHQRPLSSGMMLVEAGRTLSQVEDHRAPQEEL